MAPETVPPVPPETVPAPPDPAYDVSVSVDDDGMTGALNECIEDNNAFGPVELCPNIG